MALVIADAIVLFISLSGFIVADLNLDFNFATKIQNLIDDEKNEKLFRKH
jgi:hypothetical protein